MIRTLKRVAFAFALSALACSTIGVAVVEAASSSVSNVSVNGPAYGAAYGAGYAYVITVTFSRTETVTGTPRIQLNVTPTTRYATYTSGSGSATLTFTYNVVAGDSSALLDYSSTGALTLNGGTIRNGTTNATLNLPALASANDGLYNNYNAIDTVAPTVTSLTVLPSPSATAPTITTGISDNLGPIAAAEYFVDGAGTPGTGTPLTLAGSGTTTDTATGTVANFAALLDGPHTLSVDAQDAAGNWSATASQAFIKDLQIPSVTLTGSGTPTSQAPLSFTATFSVPVTGFTASGITVTGGTVASITGGPAIYTVVVTPSQNPSPQAGEPVTLQVNAGAALSVNTNYNGVQDPNLASNVFSQTFDNVAPVFQTSNLVAVNPATLPPGTIISPYASFQIQLVYNEPVVTTNAALHLNAATQSGVSGSGTNTLTFTFTPASVASTRLDFASTALTGTITDAAGNAASGAPVANDGLYDDNILVNGFSSQTSITPLTNTAPFTFRISSSLPIAGLNGTGAGWFNGTYGTISNIQFTPGSSSFTVQVAPPSGQNKVSISTVSGNVYYNALPGAAYWCNSYSNVAAVTAGDSLPSVAVTSAPNANFNAPLALAGTYDANGGAAVTTVQVELTPMNSGAYPPTVYTAVLNSGNWSYTVPANTLASGPYSVFAIATNGTETVSSPQTTLSIIDNTPPVTTAATYYKSGTRYFTATPNSSGYFSQNPIYVTLSANDYATGNTGIAATYYILDGGTQTTYTALSYITVSGAGKHTLSYWSVDGSGNIETTHTLPVNIQGAAPTVTLTAPAGTTYGAATTIGGTWTDPVGVKSVSVQIFDNTDFGGYTGTMLSTFALTPVNSLPGTVNADGTWSFTYTPIAASVNGTQPVEQPHWFAAVTVIANDGQSAGVGNPAQSYFAVTKATAAVNVTPYNVPYDRTPHTAVITVTGVPGETANLNALLTNNSTHTNAGTYNDSWSFAGNANYLPASGSMTDVIGPAALTITASSATVAYGDPVPTITPAYSGFLPGDNASNSLSTPPTCSTTYTQGSPVSGSPYPTTCTGAVSANYAISYVAGSVTVGVSSTTTTVTTPYDPTQYGRMTVFTATVVSGNPGAGTPTGNVQWVLDGSAAGSPVVLDGSGKATFSSNTLGIGTHTLTANYLGTSNFATSSDTFNPSVVKRLATTTVVTSNLNPAGYGVDVIYTATVSPQNASSGQPVTGSVAWQVDGTPTGASSTLSGGVATVHMNNVPAGTHTIRAVYGGDTNYTGSGSTGPAYSQVVKKATPTGGVITAPPTPIHFGTKPTVTATFTNPVAPVGSLAPASVQFLVDGTNIDGPIALVGTPTGGTASYTLTYNLPIGTHTIRAQYLGNANFVVVLSSVYSLTITP